MATKYDAYEVNPVVEYENSGTLDRYCEQITRDRIAIWDEVADDAVNFPVRLMYSVYGWRGIGENFERCLDCLCDCETEDVAEMIAESLRKTNQISY